MKNSKLKINNFLLPFCILYFAFLIGCSQPILESQECIESRDVVKTFYSFHIGNDMKPSTDYLKKREKFVSDELLKRLQTQLESPKDYFTQSEDYPKAFRAGACENAGKEKTKFEILLFWRTNEQNIQREILVEAIKEKNNWKVNKVSPKN